MNKLINTLDKATDGATILVLQRGLPLIVSKKSALIGNLLIEKNQDGFYDIYLPERIPLYENISGFDVAVIIAQRYSSGEHTIIREVLSLEEKFVKFHTDMIHYLSCMKSTKDSIRLAILEDKFQVAELHAKDIKDKITSFKRLK
jgi:hypothetical protein